MSNEMELNSEGHLSSDKVVPFSSIECKNDTDIHEIYNNVKVKQEPCLLEETSTKVKSEPEETCLDLHVKSESLPLTSVNIYEFDSDIHKDCHKIDTKIEIKEEPDCFETSAEVKFESEEIPFNDAHLNFGTKENTLAGDEFILPESTRLDTEAVWNYESGVTSTGLDKDCLKMSENYNPCHEKANINKSHGSDIIGTFHMDDEMPHKCKFCGKCFTLASNLQIHIVTHEAKRKHKCNICEKSFSTASCLKRHNLIHEGKRKFKCNVCDKSFIQSSHLKEHNLIHEGKRPFKCNKCDKSFTKLSNLKTHDLFHEGRRQHKCSTCDKSFSTSSGLKRHSVSHEGKRLFKCNVCDMSFIQATHLRDHNLIHEGVIELPYSITFENTQFNS